MYHDEDNIDSNLNDSRQHKGPPTDELNVRVWDKGREEEHVIDYH